MTATIRGRERVKLAKMQQRASLVARLRAMIVLALFAIGSFALVGRLAYVGVAEGGTAYARTGVDFVPDRADIVDRNGVPLARTIQAYSVRFVPQKMVGRPGELAEHLHKIFPDTSVARLTQLLSSERPLMLRRRVVPDVANQIHALGEPAFEFPLDQERFYPQNGLGAHLVGYMDADNKGVMGMEQAFEERLNTQNTRLQPVVMAMDVRVQAALEHELDAAMRHHDALGAAGIVMDANSGEVVALSSLPEFNPNKIGKGDIPKLVNDVTYSVYELGSTFKPLTIAAALDAGVVTNLATRYDATAPLEVGRFKIRDTHPQNRYLNVPEMLVHSSNIVTARIADNLGVQRMQNLIETLGFDTRPSIELSQRGKPLMPQSWGRVTNMTIGYGHGIAVTPLHLASAYAALVNGGVWRPASIRKLPEGEKPKGRRVFKPATSARMRQLLRMIVSDGTGSKADAPGFRVGGKTGSAEKPYEGGYKRNSVVSTFAAAFPMDDPQYVVIVMLDEPKGTAQSAFQRTAGWTAAPIVKRLVPRIGPMLGVVPDIARDVDVSELTPLLWKAKETT